MEHESVSYEESSTGTDGMWDQVGCAIGERCGCSTVETRVTDPVTGGQKGAKLEEFAYIPVKPLEEVARVYGIGAQKYAPLNFLKGYRWSLSISALLRHIFAFLRGESFDKDDNLHHLAHATFHLFALMEFERRGLGTDDRGYSGKE